MLEEEGELQRNCVRSYWPHIVESDRRIYAYRVLWPERATLTIVRYNSGIWQLSELKAYLNKAVKAETSRTVERWLYEHTFKTLA